MYNIIIATIYIVQTIIAFFNIKFLTDSWRTNKIADFDLFWFRNVMIDSNFNLINDFFEETVEIIEENILLYSKPINKKKKNTKDKYINKIFDSWTNKRLHFINSFVKILDIVNEEITSDIDSIVMDLEDSIIEKVESLKLEIDNNEFDINMLREELYSIVFEYKKRLYLKLKNHERILLQNDLKCNLNKDTCSKKFNNIKIGISIVLVFFFILNMILYNYTKNQHTIKDEIVENQIGIVIVEKLNIRNDPSINSSVLRTIDKGQTVKVLKKKGNWIQVNILNLNGWVYSQYIDIKNIEQ